MTAGDLDALDKLRSAATPGTWSVDADGDVIAAADPYTFLVTGISPADAALIVAAVNTLPDLIAEARKYRALQEAVDKLIATAPVMRFDNDYPVRAVPISDLLSIRAVVATVDGEQ